MRTMIYPEWIVGGEIESQASNFAAQDKKIYLVTAALTATLPAPRRGAKIVLKKTGDFTVTVAPNGLEQIEGVAANYLLTSARESATLISDGTHWYRV